MLNAQKVFISSQLSIDNVWSKIVHNTATASFHSFSCKTFLPNKLLAIQYAVDIKTDFVLRLC